VSYIVYDYVFFNLDLASRPPLVRKKAKLGMQNVEKKLTERRGALLTNPRAGAVERRSRDIQKASVNLGAVYKLTPNASLRATYARGVQPPTLLELSGLLIPPATAAPVGALITGNPDLAPAIVTNYALSYDRALPTLGARFGVKLFSQKTEDVKGQFSTAAADLPATATTWATYTYKNVSSSKMKGVELSAPGKIKGGDHWSADTTYTDVTDTPFTTAASLILRKVDFAATSPKYRSNLAAGWTNDTWTVDGFAHFVSKFDSYNGNVLEAVPSYSTLAARVAYRLPHDIDLALTGQNLAHDRQSQAKGPSGLQAERRILASISKTW